MWRDSVRVLTTLWAWTYSSHQTGQRMSVPIQCHRYVVIVVFCTLFVVVVVVLSSFLCCLCVCVCVCVYVCVCVCQGNILFVCF